MRPKNPQDLAKVIPASVRASSKRGDMYLELREKILKGEIPAGTEMVPGVLAKEFDVNNQSAQFTLFRLACEGLVDVRMRRSNAWPYNNVLNDYVVRELPNKPKLLSSRQGGFAEDMKSLGMQAEEIPEEVTMVHADEELADLLQCPPGEPVIFRRTIQRVKNFPDLGEVVVAISDSYLPFRFSRIMPELHQPNVNLYGLIASQFGEIASTCEETVYADFADAEARSLFGLSIDSPTPLLRIHRRVLDEKGQPIESCWITHRGDIYGLRYIQPFHFEKA